MGHVGPGSTAPGITRTSGFYEPPYEAGHSTCGSLRTSRSGQSELAAVFPWRSLRCWRGIRHDADPIFELRLGGGKYDVERLEPMLRPFPAGAILAPAPLCAGRSRR